MAHAMRVTVAGHICADLTPDLPQEARIEPGRLIGVGPLRITAGGSVANTGSALAAFGHSVRVSALVGGDELADLVRSQCAALGLDPSGIRRNPGDDATSYSIVIEPEGVDDRCFWHYPGANLAYRGDDLEAAALAGTDVLHLGYPPMLPELLRNDAADLTDLFRRAADCGAVTSLDMAEVDPSSPDATLDWPGFYRALLPYTDVFSPSVDDLASTLGGPADPNRMDEFADTLIEWGAAVVMISAGVEGVLLRTAGGDRLRRAGARLARLAEPWADARERWPAFPTERFVSTNGAGDTASAGLIHAIGCGASPNAATCFAIRAAAARIGRFPLGDLADLLEPGNEDALYNPPLTLNGR